LTSISFHCRFSLGVASVAYSSIFLGTVGSFAARLVFALALAVPAAVASEGDGHGAEAANSTKDLVYSSWQVEHPVLTGVVSAFALGLWPSDFASDVRKVPSQAVMNQGFGAQAFEYIRMASLPIFQWSRIITYLTLFLAVLYLVRRRKSVTHSSSRAGTTEGEKS